MKQNLNCDACGKPYRDFAPEGAQTCECHKKLLRALRDDYMTDHSVRSPSTDGESAICASSLNKPSSQEGLNAGERRAQLRALLHGINAKIGICDPNWWDVAAEIVNEEIEALARHPPFNDAIEAAAQALREHDMKGRITLPWEKVPKSQRRKWLEKASVALTASLKLPDYRGGEKIDSTKTAESNHSPSTLNAETE